MSEMKTLTLEEAMEIMAKNNGALVLKDRPDITGLPEGLNNLRICGWRLRWCQVFA